jgi:hypothetical protein
MKFGAIFRLAAIALGIVSATIMAQRGFEIRFNEDFLGFFDAVDHLIGGMLGPVEEYLIRPALRALAALGVEIQLQDHWKYVSILLWLSLGSWARGAASKRFPQWSVFQIVWAVLCALLGGVLVLGIIVG